MTDGLIGRETPLHMTKYDGSDHRRWPAWFVMKDGSLYVLRVIDGAAMSRTPDPADDPEPTLVRGGGNLYVWDDRWYNVAQGLREGRMRYYVLSLIHI